MVVSQKTERSLCPQFLCIVRLPLSRSFEFVQASRPRLKSSVEQSSLRAYPQTGLPVAKSNVTVFAWPATSVFLQCHTREQRRRWHELGCFAAERLTTKVAGPPALLQTRTILRRRDTSTINEPEYAAELGFLYCLRCTAPRHKVVVRG
jgi:hypothetical protein